ncbi:hypothetical protein VDG39_14055 [Xanthomonas campestris pv. raphani]|uniref:hypothetical protein n=1 Tax=Xanthomonas campestris TaxID=339 RepID=UPI002B239077|nr:hypothetical protein [Xanthomonas campestris]MEA9913822.1 hypothetical protein [Xanthomonas campestris pv. raphani]
MESTSESIVRLYIGFTGPDGNAEPSPEIKSVIKSDERFFSDFMAYLISLLGVAMCLEAARSGSSSAYRVDDAISIGSRLSPARWIWKPNSAISDIGSNSLPYELRLERQPYLADESPPGELPLGSLEAMLYCYGQALGANYFERNRARIQSRYGDQKNWPDVWRFAVVVRNAMAHGGAVYFNRQDAPPVVWKSVTYSPTDNGKRLLHHDLWPGDLMDLILEMDQAISDNN